MRNHGDGKQDTEYIMAYVYCTFQKSKYVLLYTVQSLLKAIAIGFPLLFAIAFKSEKEQKILENSMIGWLNNYFEIKGAPIIFSITTVGENIIATTKIRIYYGAI